MSQQQGSEDVLFELFDGFMGFCSDGFANKHYAFEQWNAFKELIHNRQKIEYHQAFSFISSIQADMESSETPHLPLPPHFHQDSHASNRQSSSGQRSNHPSSSLTQPFKTTKSYLQAEQTTMANNPTVVSRFEQRQMQQSQKGQLNTNQSQQRSSTRERDYHSQGAPVQLTHSTAIRTSATNHTNQQATLNASKQTSSSSTTTNPVNSLTNNSQSSLQNNSSIQQSNPQIRGSFNSTAQSSKQQQQQQINNGLSSSQKQFQSLTRVCGTTGNPSSQGMLITGSCIESSSTYTLSTKKSPVRAGISKKYASVIESETAISPHHSRASVFSTRPLLDLLKDTTRGGTSLSSSRQLQQAHLIDLQIPSNSAVKLIAVMYFVSLTNSLSTAAPQKDIFSHFARVSTKQMTFSTSDLLTFSREDLEKSFTRNIGKVLQMYFAEKQSGQSVERNSFPSLATRLSKVFLNLISIDPLFLDSLVQLLKDLSADFVENCDYQVISILFSSEEATNADKRQKLAAQLRQPSWREVKPEWLYILSLTLHRPIELFTLRDNKLEQTVFTNKKQSIAVLDPQKISLLTVAAAHGDRKIPVYSLLTMKHFDTDLFKSYTLDEAVLQEEVNLQYVLDLIAQDNDNLGVQVHQQQPLAQMQLQQQQLRQNPRNASPGMSDQHALLAHRNSKLNTHLAANQKNYQANQIATTATAAQHQTSVDQQDQNGKKSATSRQNPTHHLSSTASLNAVAAQQQQNLPQQSPRTNNLQQQIIQPPQTPEDYKHGAFAIGKGKYSHYETSAQQRFPQPIFQSISNPSTISPLTVTGSQDDWNRSLLIAKVNDLRFSLSIHSDQMNSLARFSLSSTQTVVSKENLQPYASKSPLKYKKEPFSNDNVGNGSPTPPSPFPIAAFSASSESSRMSLQSGATTTANGSNSSTASQFRQNHHNQSITQSQQNNNIHNPQTVIKQTGGSLYSSGSANPYFQSYSQQQQQQQQQQLLPSTHANQYTPSNLQNGTAQPTFAFASQNSQVSRHQFNQQNNYAGVQESTSMGGGGFLPAKRNTLSNASSSQETAQRSNLFSKISPRGNLLNTQM